MVYENFKRLVSLYLMDKRTFRNNCLHTVREADESRYNSAVAENEHIEKRLAEIMIELDSESSRLTSKQHELNIVLSEHRNSIEAVNDFLFRLNKFTSA